MDVLKKATVGLEDIKEHFNINILKNYGLATLMSYYYSSFDVIIENFYENRLSTLICNYYNKSITNAVTGAFQEEFMPEEFGYYK